MRFASLLLLPLVLLGCDTMESAQHCAAGTSIELTRSNTWWIEVRPAPGASAQWIGGVEVDGQVVMSRTSPGHALYSQILEGDRVRATFQYAGGDPVTVALYNRNRQDYQWGCDASGTRDGFVLVERQELGPARREVVVEARR